MRVIGVRGAPPDQVAQALIELAGGRGNNGQTVTLTANVATTTVAVRGFAPTDCITFDPLTANAATELYGATMYVLEANRTANQIIITHANSAQTDRKFRMTWAATL